MKQLLSNLGIDNLNSFIYEYEPINLNWWDSENETSIEIEVHLSEEDIVELSVVFCPEAEGIVERDLVFAMSFKSGSLQSDALIAKKVCEKIIRKNSFEYSEEHHGYIIRSFEDAREVMVEIADLLTNKVPIHKFDMTQSDDEEEVSFKRGDALDHFIAMMYMNSLAYTKENIIENIELGLQYEGAEYLKDLKSDVLSEAPLEIDEEYQVDEEALELIKETIKNYRQDDV